MMEDLLRAEVARLTTALHDESRSPDGDGQDTTAPRLDGWDVQAANGGAPRVPDLASQTPLTMQEEARAASDVASPMRRRSIAGSEPADSLSDLRVEVARLTQARDPRELTSEMREYIAAFLLLHPAESLTYDDVFAMVTKVLNWGPLPPWQPIETAPKDHSRFLAIDTNHNINVFRWTSASTGRLTVGIDGWQNVGTQWIVTNLTHWMPLPAAPERS